MTFVSVLRAVDCLQEAADPAAVFQLTAALSRLTAASRSLLGQATAALPRQRSKVDLLLNLADAILDVGKALHFISFAGTYIFVLTIISTCPYLVHDVSMSSIIYLFMIILSLPACDVPSPPV